MARVAIPIEGIGVVEVEQAAGFFSGTSIADPNCDAVIVIPETETKSPICAVVITRDQLVEMLTQIQIAKYEANKKSRKKSRK